MGQAGSGAAQGAAAGSAAGPWGAAIGGAVGLVGGMAAENKQNDYEHQQQEALAADQAKRDAFAAQQQALYGPTQQRLTEEAANPMPLNYGLNLGQINKQTLGGEQRLNAIMAKNGMTGSGAQAAGLQGLEKGRVGELASAFQTGLQARTQLGMGLLQHYNPLGNTQLQTGALPQQVGFGAREQGIYGKAMGEGYGAVGKGLGGFLGGLGPGQQPQVAPGMNGANMDTLEGTTTPGMGGGNPQIQGVSPQMPGTWNTPNMGETFQPPPDMGYFANGGMPPAQGLGMETPTPTFDLSNYGGF